MRLWAAAEGVFTAAHHAELTYTALVQQLLQLLSALLGQVVKPAARRCMHAMPVAHASGAVHTHVSAFSNGAVHGCGGPRALGSLESPRVIAGIDSIDEVHVCHSKFTV